MTQTECLANRCGAFGAILESIAMSGRLTHAEFRFVVNEYINNPALGDDNERLEHIYRSQWIGMIHNEKMGSYIAPSPFTENEMNDQ